MPLIAAFRASRRSYVCGDVTRWCCRLGGHAWPCDGEGVLSSGALRDEGGQFAVGADVSVVEGPARCPGRSQRERDEVRFGGGDAVGLGEAAELVHDPDQAAVLRRRQLAATHPG